MTATLFSYATWHPCLRYEACVQARCNFALFEILAELDPAKSADLLRQACQAAEWIGEVYSDRDCLPPAMIAGYEPLALAFTVGQEASRYFDAQADAFDQLMGPQPSYSYTGEWSSDDGVDERRVCVIEAEEGHLGYVETSHRGGESSGNIVSGPFKTMQEAREAAYECLVQCD